MVQTMFTSVRIDAILGEYGSKRLVLFACQFVLAYMHVHIKSMNVCVCVFEYTNTQAYGP